MKPLLIIIFLVFANTITSSAQSKHEAKIDVYLNDYQNNRMFKATSEKSAYFANAFLELLEEIKTFKDAINNAEGNVNYRIRQISIKNPLTRNNGQKIFNGFAFGALESVDKEENLLCTFVYDIDSNALYADINHNGRYQKLLYANQEDINKCAKYCRFSK